MASIFFIKLINGEKKCKATLNSGPHHIAGKLFILKKWQPGVQFSENNFASIPIQVKFYNVPMVLCTRKNGILK